MPSFSKPKAVTVKDVLDWNYADLATCSGHILPAGGNDSKVGLYNDSQIGEWLFVYDVQFNGFAVTFGYYYAIQGPLTTPFATALPIVCDAPIPRGITFTDEVVHVPPGPTLPFATVQNLGAVGPIRGGGPLAVIKPGYSLVFQVEGELMCTFRYLVIGN